MTYSCYRCSRFEGSLVSYQSETRIVEKIKLTASVNNLPKSSWPRKLNAYKAFIEAQMRKNDEATSRQKNKRSFSSMVWKFIPQLWSKYQTYEFHSYAMRLFSREYCVNKCICRRGLSLFVIKFRYNARPDWLKQRALSEYRCTESRCHAISPFVKCRSCLSFFYFVFYSDVLYNLENENEVLASMDIDHPVRNSTNNMFG